MAETPNAEDLLSQLGPALAGGPHPERRLGRVLAFLTMYETDLARHNATTILDRLVASVDAGFSDPPITAEVRTAAGQYARELVQGTLAKRPEIDAVIQERAPSWPMAQMSAIDRNVLRLGLYESLYGSATVPLRAAINEAVELAKLFGSETSAKFVNGVLGRAVERGGGQST